jgi:K+-sensing histidine kinase KdpD
VTSCADLSPERRIAVLGIVGANSACDANRSVRSQLPRPKSVDRKGDGTGLGLALSFGIIRDAGGTPSLLSSRTGANLQIDLPADTG